MNNRPLEVGGVAGKETFNPPIPKVCFHSNQPPSIGAFQKHLININPGVVERGLL